MLPKVSVIVAVYNAADYLEQCLNSIIAQTMSEIEIICVDDGSIDNSLDILYQFMNRDSRIIVIDSIHENAGAARNRGIQEAKGEYLAFWDADDCFDSNALMSLYSKAVSTDSDVTVCRCQSFSDLSTDFSPLDGAFRKDLFPTKAIFSYLDCPQYLFQLFGGWAWDKLFKRSFINDEHIFFQAQKVTNDGLFVYSAMAYARRIATVDDILVSHRTGNAKSLEHNRSDSIDCCLYYLLALQKALRKKNIYTVLEQSYVNMAASYLVWFVMSLPEAAHDKLYKLFHFEWIHLLGFDIYAKEYFYSGDVYDLLSEIIKKPPIEKKPYSVLLAEMKKLNEKYTAERLELEKVRHELIEDTRELAEIKKEKLDIENALKKLNEKYNVERLKNEKTKHELARWPELSIVDKTKYTDFL